MKLDQEQEEIKRKRVEQVLKVLADGGGEIVYASISGNIILLDENGNKPDADVRISIEIFLNLRERNRIKEIGSMRQGHHIFHGLVVFYGIS